jgi:transposase, IS5 family
MKQTSFAGLEYAGKERLTRREKLLGEMDKVVPWSRLQALIEPHYPRSGKVGRPPIGVPRMLRMYFLQQCYTLADEALEDTLYDSHAMREFVGIDLGREQVPDATTLLKFRRLLEQHDLTVAILAEVNAHLSERGLLMRQGTVVDATIIAAPSSTKNEDGKRDPEMHQTKKGNQWHYGMKMHIGVDAQSGLIHSVHTTAANEADVAHAHELLHGREEFVHGDAGYTGLDRRDEIIQAQVRAIVEHPFHVIKNLFGYRKVSYRGLAKNHVRAQSHAALVNLLLARRRLLDGQVRPQPVH